MSKTIARYYFALAIIITAAISTVAQNNSAWSQNVSPLPSPTGFVNDYAGVLDAQTKLSIETKIKEFSETTSPKVELAVAVVKTTGDRPIFDYSLAVARGWGIGTKNDDNPSALLLIAVDDRKYFTQVSKDLEDELPDGVVGSLQRQFLVPEFRKGNYGKGISDTIDAYIYTIRNKGNAPVAKATPAVRDVESEGGISLFGIFCCAAIILVIFVIFLSNRGGKNGPSARDRDRWGGGGFGSGGGSGSALPWIIGGVLGSGGGSSSSGSDWGGSSGGSDWGGFGGGGDFGGGGAGGDW